MENAAHYTLNEASKIFLRMLEGFYRIDPKFEVSNAIVFLDVACHEDCSFLAVFRRTRLSMDRLRRAIAVLAPPKKQGQKAYDLVGAVKTRARMDFFLTDKGRHFFEDVSNLDLPLDEMRLLNS